MVIEGKDFKMTLIDDYQKFDLELLYVVNAKIPEKRREEFKLVGYGLTRERCVEKIINYRLDKKHESISLENYLKEIKLEREIILESFNGTNIS